MAKFLVVGALAWDRPIYLREQISTGARIRGDALGLDEGGAVSGRLGGGGANAACALVSAGHKAAVFAPVAMDQQGDDILRSAEQCELDTSYVRRMDYHSGATLVLIDPSGERAIIGVDKGETWRAAAFKSKFAPITDTEVRAAAPNGAYIRAPIPGWSVVTAAAPVVVAHWPLGDAAERIDADVLIGSADDLHCAGVSSREIFAHASRAATARLAWAVVTRGEEGGDAFSAHGHIAYRAPRVRQIDSTGAGDAFAAGVLEALVSGAPMEKALSHGAGWGAAAAALRGSAIATPGVFSPFA